MKNPPKEESETQTSNSKVSSTKPAILAIEIVDSNNEDASSSKNKNAKRTIETSVGYGFQHMYAAEEPPKFEIYKYSQNDIPPYKPDTNKLYSKGGGSVEILKAKTYHLGSSVVTQGPEYLPPSFSQPSSHAIPHTQTGTTLYSTVDKNGKVGDLSLQVPYQDVPQSGNGYVPVILLRVYTNQLTNPSAFYPNLPQTHPFSHLNSINLQTLLGGLSLNNYVSSYTAQPQDYHQTIQHQEYRQAVQPEEYHQTVQAQAHRQTVQPQVHHQSVQPQVFSPTVQPQIYQTAMQPQLYQPAAQYHQLPQPQVYLQMPYDEAKEYYNQHKVPAYTYENYPDDAHTRVIFHNQQKEKVETTEPPAVYSTVNYKYQMVIPQKDQNIGYYYVNPSNQQMYYPSQYYQMYIPQGLLPKGYQIQGAPSQSIVSQEYHYEDFEPDNQSQSQKEYPPPAQEVYSTAVQKQQSIKGSSQDLQNQYLYHKHSNNRRNVTPLKIKQNYVKDNETITRPTQINVRPTGKRNVKIISADSTRTKSTKRSKKTVDSSIKTVTDLEESK